MHFCFAVLKNVRILVFEYIFQNVRNVFAAAILAVLYDKRGENMEMPTVFVLTAFNQAHKKMNVIYHNYAKSVGLSDAAFWLIYSLYEHGYPCTQRELCESWFYAPQTINSALKALEEKGIITLEATPNNRKNKQVRFTEIGDELVREKLVPLVQAEERSFERLDEEERSRLLEITQKHIGILEEEINKLSSED